ncbi:hypothetical protein Hanom_Chr13g01235261 [Helianthus anomalus]
MASSSCKRYANSRSDSAATAAVNSRRCSAAIVVSSSMSSFMFSGVGPIVGFYLVNSNDR